eukprot:1271664-Prymnesium_polylepis.1
MFAGAGGWQTKEQQLVVAVKANEFAQVKRLLALKADPNWIDGQQSSQRETTMHAACQHKEAAALVKLLLDGGATADVADVDDWRPVHWASYYNAEQALNRLVEHGVDVNAKTRRGETPLHWACKNNSARAVRALGVSPALQLDALCTQQESPRDWAIRHDSQDALRELTALGEALRRSGVAR